MGFEHNATSNTNVRRLYMSNKQYFINQMVEICICSTTKTHLEPYSRVAISAASRTTFSLGSMRLLLVCEIMDMPTMRIVSVTC